MDLPYAYDLTLIGLKALFDQGNLDKVSARELQKKGYMDPTIWGKILGASSTGSIVWLPQDSTGRQPTIEQNSADILGDTSIILTAGVSALPSVMGWDQTQGRVQNLKRRIGIVEFTSNAGGTLDADVNLVAAVGSYYGVFQLLGIWSDAGESPTFVFNNTIALGSVAHPAFTAGAVSKALEDIVWQGSADNTVISLDTTSSGLGNAKNYAFLYYYWYET